MKLHESGDMRIAVIVPAPYSGGTMRAALNVALQIHDGSRTVGEPVIVEFGYVDAGQAEVHAGFGELRHRKIPYRPIRIERCSPATLAGALDGELGDLPLVYFNDGVSNFDDADFVLIVSDRITGGVVSPSYRFGMVIYDFIQRYVPDIFEGEDASSAAAIWRDATSMLRNYARAEAIFVTTDQAASDAVSFGGVSRHRVVKLPMDFDPLEKPNAQPQQSAESTPPYIIWTTNYTSHKNQLRALSGLELFLKSHPEVGVIVTGVGTEVFDPASPENDLTRLPIVKKIRSKISASELLKKRVSFRGNLEDSEYYEVLRNAKVLFHPAIIDNGTFSVIEAAWCGVPSASSRYAPMEEISKRFELPLVFFDWSDPVDMQNGLTHAFENREEIVSSLPSKERLSKFARGADAANYWRAIAAHLA
jgi:glycosyltransferase involved in cell wall biosynthesis